MKLQNLSKLVLSLGVAGVLVACGNGGSTESSSTEAESNAETTESTATEALTGEIIVVSREDGSGTRGAFTELTGVLVKEGDNEVDKTTSSAEIQNSTDAVMTTVSGETNAIGYVSLGSLNDTVKAVQIDGVDATEENVLNSTYAISRPFNIAWKGDLEGAAKDFHDFIMSADGQAVVTDNGYVTINAEAPAYAGDGKMEGEVNVVGSTSVSPVMEKIAEAYMAVNPGVKISITSNGSSAGMTAAMDGTAQIGMASRELKDEEKAELNSDAMARDGIGVIVNHDNGLTNLTLEQVRQIFTGEVTEWEAVK